MEESARAFPGAGGLCTTCGSSPSSPPRIRPTIRRHMEELCFPSGQPRDLRRAAVVECAPGFALPALSAPVDNAVQESASLTAARGSRVDLEVVFCRGRDSSSCNQLYDPHWFVEIQSATDPAHDSRRASRIESCRASSCLPADLAGVSLYAERSLRGGRHESGRLVGDGSRFRPSPLETAHGPLTHSCPKSGRTRISSNLVVGPRFDFRSGAERKRGFSIVTVA